MSIILPLGRLRQEDHLKSDQVRLHREYQATQDSVFKKKVIFMSSWGLKKNLSNWGYKYRRRDADESV